VPLDAPVDGVDDVDWSSGKLLEARVVLGLGCPGVGADVGERDGDVRGEGVEGAWSGGFVVEDRAGKRGKAGRNDHQGNSQRDPAADAAPVRGRRGERRR
jgi:hypothetical protein